MTAFLSTNKACITVDIPADRVEAFTEMWRQFVAGETPYDAAIRERAADSEQGVASLRHLFGIANGHSGQCRYVARFLLGLYNGLRFPFDLTDLRGLDAELVEHCLAVLRLDSRPAQEVHCYFEAGSERFEALADRWRVLDHYGCGAPPSRAAPENRYARETRERIVAPINEPRS